MAELPSTFDEQEILRFLQSVSSRAELVRLWSQARDATEAGVALSSHSRQHPNGFYQIALRGLQSEALGVRLHIWTDIAAAAESDIHDHPWDFYSQTLCGQLLHEVLRESPEGDIYNKLVCHRPELNKPEIICDPCEAKLHRAAAYQLNPSSWSYFHHQEIHRVVPIAVPAATLVVRSHALSRSTTIYRRPAPRPTEKMSRWISLPQADNLVAQIAASLG